MSWLSEQLLARDLVHGQAARQHAAPHVGHAGQLEQALQGAILAVRSVQHGKHDVDGGKGLPRRAGHQVAPGLPDSRVAPAQHVGPARAQQGMRVATEQPTPAAGNADGHDLIALLAAARSSPSEPKRATRRVRPTARRKSLPRGHPPCRPVSACLARPWLARQSTVSCYVYRFDNGFAGPLAKEQDFGNQADVRGPVHLFTQQVDQRHNVGGGRAACIHDKVCVARRNLRAANLMSLQAQRLDEPAGMIAGWVAKDAARTRLDRLGSPPPCQVFIRTAAPTRPRPRAAGQTRPPARSVSGPGPGPAAAP